MKIQKVIGQELGYEFVRIDPDREDLLLLKLSLKYFDALNDCLINWSKEHW